MSGDLDLDAILAEFRQGETAKQEPAAAPRRRRTETPLPENPYGEASELRPARPPRHAAPEPQPLPREPQPLPREPAAGPADRASAPRPVSRQPASPPKPQGQSSQPIRPQQRLDPVRVTPAASPRPQSAGRPAERPRDQSPRPRPSQPRPAAPAPRKKGGKGPLFLVLLLLAVLLAGLVWWTVRDERMNAPAEPEPVRLELGQSLEDYLAESSGSSRN